MTFEEFDKFQDELWKECVEMRNTKGKEYAHSEDRFANFNRLAEELDVRNILIAWVYTTKHLDSIGSFVKTGKIFSSEGIRGRIVDAIVYLTLIAGMLEEDSREIEKLGIACLCGHKKAEHGGNRLCCLCL